MGRTRRVGREYMVESNEVMGGQSHAKTLRSLFIPLSSDHLPSRFGIFKDVVGAALT